MACPPHRFRRSLGAMRPIAAANFPTARALASRLAEARSIQVAAVECKAGGIRGRGRRGVATGGAGGATGRGNGRCRRAGAAGGAAECAEGRGRFAAASLARLSAMTPEVPKRLRPPLCTGTASNARSMHGRRADADMRQIRPGINSPCRASGPWAPVRRRRRPKPESNWGRPNDSERPRMLLLPVAGESELLCARFAPRSTVDRKSGFRTPPPSGRVACIHRHAGAMSRHRPCFAAGTGRGTR